MTNSNLKTTLLIGLLAATLLACAGPAEQIAVPTPPTATEPTMSETTSAPRPSPPPLQLVESWPIETTLDNPTIPDAPDVWLEMIDNAQHTLDFEHFYGVTAENSRLEPIIDAIGRAAARGVQVRFLFDEVFYAREAAVPDRLRAIDGIEVRIIGLGKHTGGIQHAKFFVVDGRQAYIGSQNFDWRSLTHIQELGLRLSSESLVATVADVFELDWQLAGGVSLREALPSAPAPERVPVLTHTLAYHALGHDDATVQVTPAFSPTGLLPVEEYWDLPLLVALIEGAQTRVRVQVMSYSLTNHDGSTYTGLDDALVAAAARGVQVELMVADWSKGSKKMARLQELQALDNVTVKVVSIPEWSGGFVPFARVIHAKLMTIDSEHAWVGTSNWSGDYFHQSRNMGFVLEGATITADVNAFFERAWLSEYATVVAPEAEYEAPRYRE